MINQLRRDVRAKHYKPLLLLITLDFLDKQKPFAAIIPAKKIVDEFEIIMRKIGYKKEHNKGWMPFWHLSGDDIWNLYSINHQIVKRTAFKQFKPKTFDWINPDVHGDKTSVKGFTPQDIELIDSDWVEETFVSKDDPDFSLVSDTTTTNGAGETVGVSKTSKFGYKDAMYISVIQQLISRIETLEGS